MRIAASIVLSLALSACAAGGARLSAYNEAPFERTEDGRLLVEVGLNGAGPFPFVVDTGAGASLVDTELARELELNSRRFELTIMGLSSTARLPAFGPASLEVGADVVELPWVLVHDFDQPEARGVLGLDLLTRYAVEIDAVGGVIRLHTDRIQSRRGRTATTSVALTDNPYGLPIVAYELNGRPGRALVDTGIGGLVVDPEHGADAGVSLRRVETDLVDLANETMPINLFGQGTLEIGGATWSGIEMALVRPIVFDHLSELGVTALAGAAMFNGGSLTLDFPEGRMVISARRDRRLGRGSEWTGRRSP